MSSRVLVGILDWGLGHATRSAPVIRKFIQDGYEPVIISAGTSLEWLKNEFPELKTHSLPSLRIRYPSRFSFMLPWYTGWQLWQSRQAFRNEQKMVEKWTGYYRPVLIFSDNRPAFFSTRVKSIYMTHQLRVLAPFASRLATALHRRLMEPFTEIHVPDFEKEPSLSGKMGHPTEIPKKVKYIGPLSRYTYKPAVEKTDWLILLSGPEKQRTVLENIILEHPHLFQGRVVLIRGTTQRAQKAFPSQWEVLDLANGLEVYRHALQARRILSRSGYSSLMDWFSWRRKALLVPTPGQPEQVYLARHMQHLKWFPCIPQHRLHLLNTHETTSFFRFINSEKPLAHD